jgi:hypothetical protein
MHRLRSSFFYFLFPIVGGTFAAVALCFYYSRVLRTRSFAFGFLALLIGLIAHISIYSSIAKVLPAPFYLRDFLNLSSGVTASSLMGLFIAFTHLVLMRKRDHVDVMIFIEREWPTIPNLVCCGIGGLINIALLSAIFFVYN